MQTSIFSNLRANIKQGRPTQDKYNPANKLRNNYVFFNHFL